MYAICHDIPFDIGRVINKDILERTERASNTALGFPSLIIELDRPNQVSILNEENTQHPMPLYIKSLKIKPRKLIRQVPRDVPDYDSRREDSEEEEIKEQEEE